MASTTMLIILYFVMKVQIRVRLQCQPLLETQFKPIIVDNYYSQNHFWFELDHVQTSRLTSLLASQAVAPGTLVPRNTMKQRTFIQSLPPHDTREEGEGLVTLVLEAESLKHSSQKPDTREVASSLERNNQPLEAQLDTKLVHQEEKDLICKKLKELALKSNVNSKCQDVSLSGDVEDTSRMNDLQSDDKSCPAIPIPGDVENTICVDEISSENKCNTGELMGVEDKTELTPCLPPEYSSIFAQVIYFFFCILCYI